MQLQGCDWRTLAGWPADPIIPAMHERIASGCLATALAIVLVGCTVVPQRPAPGLYAGELCTAVADGPLHCGAAEVFLARDRAKVRVSDFIYDLALQDGQVEVLLIHGRTLVDVWSAGYSWDGHYLRFLDEERRTSYRVRFADPAQGQATERQGD